MTFVCADQQSAIADGKAICLARDLGRPLFFSVGCVEGHDDAVTANIEGVSSHGKANGMTTGDLPLETFRQAGC